MSYDTQMFPLPKGCLDCPSCRVLQQGVQCILTCHIVCEVAPTWHISNKQFLRDILTFQLMSIAAPGLASVVVSTIRCSLIAINNLKQTLSVPLLEVMSVQDCCQECIYYHDDNWLELTMQGQTMCK